MFGKLWKNIDNRDRWKIGKLGIMNTQVVF